MDFTGANPLLFGVTVLVFNPTVHHELKITIIVIQNLLAICIEPHDPAEQRKLRSQALHGQNRSPVKIPRFTLYVFSDPMRSLS